MSMDRRTNGLVGVVTAMDLPEQAWHGTWCSQILVGLAVTAGTVRIFGTKELVQPPAPRSSAFAMCSREGHLQPRSLQ